MRVLDGLTAAPPAQASAAAPVSRPPSVWLRYAGMLSIGAAVLAYLLQGFRGELLAYRDWFGFSATLLCAAGGWLAFRAFNDRAGVRLLFALALVFVPVQFAHLSSLLVDINAAASAHALAMLPTPSAWLLQVVLSALLGALVARTGFRVLCARRIDGAPWLWLLLCVSLLMPFRTGLLTGVHLVLAVGATRWIARFSLTGSQLERLGLASAVALPAFVVAGRSLLTLPAGLMEPAMISALGFAGLLLPAWLPNQPKLIGAVRFVSALCLSLGWLLLADEWLPPNTSAHLSAAFIPVLVGTGWLARAGQPAATALQLQSALWLAFYASALFGDHGVEGAIWGLGSALPLGILAVYGKQRGLLCAYTLVAATALFVLLSTALSANPSLGWLFLGVLGLTLVLMAGAWDRYSPRLNGIAQTVRDWPAAGTAARSPR